MHGHRATALRLLLTGDVEPPGQRASCGSGADLRADVLKVPHHGSSRQDPAFFAATGARLAVASAGLDNDYGHPAPRTVQLVASLGDDAAADRPAGLGRRRSRPPRPARLAAAHATVNVGGASDRDREPDSGSAQGGARAHDQRVRRSAGRGSARRGPGRRGSVPAGPAASRGSSGCRRRRRGGRRRRSRVMSKRFGSSNTSGSRLAAASSVTTHWFRCDRRRPPARRRACATRAVCWTGGSKRSTSSATAAARSGSATSSSHCSRSASSQRTPLPMALTVVSKPAISSSRASAASSASVEHVRPVRRPAPTPGRRPGRRPAGQQRGEDAAQLGVGRGDASGPDERPDAVQGPGDRRPQPPEALGFVGQPEQLGHHRDRQRGGEVGHQVEPSAVARSRPAVRWMAASTSGT